MVSKNKKKNKLTFMKYLGWFLGIVTITLCALTFFINILPIEYYVVMVILLLIIDIVVIGFLLSRGKIFNILGIIFSIIIIIFMVIGINYELNTIDFFKQFGFNSYKTENYNILVLKSSSFTELNDLDNKNIGHLDSDEHKGLHEVILKMLKKINFESIILEDIGKLSNNLVNGEVDAIILEDAQLEILKEENIDIFNLMQIIASFEIDVEIPKIGDSVDVTKDSFNILISGIDTYGSITKVSRSDVNILVTVNPTTNKILLTSIPRDYYVKLKGYDAYDKLTHAGIYGIETSVGTVEDLLDTKINYYVKVNFTSLIELVDALGGITIQSNYEFTSQDGYYYKLGVNELNGEEALSFSRERKAFEGGDRVRGENQQIILSALISKVLSPKIITNYNNLLKALKDKFVTNITDEEISKFIKMQIESGKTWKIDSISLDGTDASEYTYSYKNSKLYVMQPNLESVNNAKEKINNVLLEN